MPLVVLRAPLKDMAGGKAALEVPGSTVGQVLRAVEIAWPRTKGYVLDEHGRVRRHVNVFLNGELVREDATVGPDDRLQVLPSISGGSS